jgi:hypothetical protein
MTAGVLEQLDEEEARRAGADAILKKPFEASAVIETVRPLIEQAQRDKQENPPEPGPAMEPPLPPAMQAVVEPERVRAAVTVALDAAMPALIDEITERVLIALGH